MGEWSKLVQDIKHNKDAFVELVEKMNPLINKYVRLLYKDEREDVREELILALWEAMSSIKYYDNDGECMAYLRNALRLKFLELYRKSKKRHEFQLVKEPDATLAIIEMPSGLLDISDVIFREDIRALLKQFDGKGRDICFQILLEEKSDSQIAKNLEVSRQYVNRLRRNLFSYLKTYYFR
ncbi:MAG: sigma-70 family RNA polymerase sigma factor [Lachnospiraceae bacterium]|nr:sigma-70 family RNA polymerase sigma factor [uncultured Acetatifactor sp.]MCI9220979.1 sigma-70 family RNA polymerase sigma factor [Lachnospiraceae bacterium]